jgi:hypothetical protein
MPYAHYDRLTALDDVFLEIENDAVHMHVGAVALFESEPLRDAAGHLDIERIRAFTAAAMQDLPRFRQRLAWGRPCHPPTAAASPARSHCRPSRRRARCPPGSRSCGSGRPRWPWPCRPCRPPTAAASPGRCRWSPSPPPARTPSPPRKRAKRAARRAPSAATDEPWRTPLLASCCTRRAGCEARRGRTRDGEMARSRSAVRRIDTSAWRPRDGPETPRRSKPCRAGDLNRAAEAAQAPRPAPSRAARESHKIA